MITDCTLFEQKRCNNCVHNKVCMHQEKFLLYKNELEQIVKEKRKDCSVLSVKIECSSYLYKQTQTIRG
jgi:hypothetical protein